jgi:predicted DsbA family dithiol-disulfide isomerase
VLVEIWSDVVCPWCFIGKRRFERAMADFEHSSAVQVVYRSFELAPHAPAQDDRSLQELLAAKYRVSMAEAAAMNHRVEAAAAGEGLDYRLDLAHPANSFDAHRLIHFARTHDRQAEMVELLYRAYFCDGLLISDAVTLRGLAARLGLPEAPTREMLESDQFAAEVRADEGAARQLDITGVPFFAIERRFGLSGAHDPASLLKVLRHGWEQTEGG